MTFAAPRPPHTSNAPLLSLRPRHLVASSLPSCADIAIDRAWCCRVASPVVAAPYRNRCSFGLSPWQAWRSEMPQWLARRPCQSQSWPRNVAEWMCPLRRPPTPPRRTVPDRSSCGWPDRSCRSQRRSRPLQLPQRHWTRQPRVGRRLRARAATPRARLQGGRGGREAARGASDARVPEEKVSGQRPPRGPGKRMAPAQAKLQPSLSSEPREEPPPCEEHKELTAGLPKMGLAERPANTKQAGAAINERGAVVGWAPDLASDCMP